MEIERKYLVKTLPDLTSCPYKELTQAKNYQIYNCIC